MIFIFTLFLKIKYEKEEKEKEKKKKKMFNKIAEVEKQRSRLREACATNAAMSYLNLIGKITGMQYPTDKLLKETIGKTYEHIEFLQKFLHSNYPTNDLSFMYRDVTDTQAFIKKVDTWIFNHEKMNALYTVMIDILQKWLEQNTKVISENHLISLQTDIVAAHDLKLIKENHVYHFYSDGEITSTKGGEIYGTRSTFSMSPPLIDKFMLTLPMQNSGLTYAVVTYEKAKEFRERMIQIAKRI
jgi:hypothetical protein